MGEQHELERYEAARQSDGSPAQRAEVGMNQAFLRWDPEYLRGWAESLPRDTRRILLALLDATEAEDG